MAVVKFSPPSPKQVLANQQNAQKSTGPKTPEGKTHSSQNAIKHGLLAKSVVINSPFGAEARADFDALLADLCDELRPQGFIEQSLVERIATCYWRLHRAQRFESGSIRESLEVPDPHTDHLQKLQQQFPKEEHLLWVMERLADLFAKPAKDLLSAETDEINNLAQEFPPSPIELLYGVPDNKPDRLRQNLPAMRLDQMRKVKELKEQLHHAQEHLDIWRSRQSQVCALPNEINLLKLIRYETMLDRQIHRALNELRRLRASEKENSNA